MSKPKILEIEEIVDSHTTELSSHTTQLADIAIQIDKFSGTDDEKFQQALDSAKVKGYKIIFSNDKTYTFNNDYYIDFPIVLEGTIGTLAYETTLKYNGDGVFLHFKYDDAQTRKCTGINIKNLIIEGNPSAVCGIKVNEYNEIATSMRGFTLENVVVKKFVNGWGANLNNCYGNTIHNCTFTQNGADFRLKNAHGTSFFGGSIENSIFGTSVETSRPVNFYGTVMEGYVAGQVTELGGQIPSDLFVWNGWINEDGFYPVFKVRTTPNDYVGTAVRNFGSVLNMYGNYFELNDFSILNELDTVTNVNGCWIELSGTNKCFIDCGHGKITANDNYIVMNTTDISTKLICLSRTTPNGFEYKNNTGCPTQRIIGGHGITGEILSLNITDNYAYGKDLEKVTAKTIFIYCSNVWSSFYFYSANAPVMREGDTIKLIARCHSVDSKIRFGADINGLNTEYETIPVGTTKAYTFCFIGGKLECIAKI